MRRIRIATCALLLVLALDARADEVPAEDAPVAVPEAEAPVATPDEAAPAAPEPGTAPAEPRAAALTPAEPVPPYVPTDGRTAIDAWDRERGIRYGTDMLFPFTRGMQDAGIRGWARWPMALVTVPLDVALLPTGVVAGLFGG